MRLFIPKFQNYDLKLRHTKTHVKNYSLKQKPRYKFRNKTKYNYMAIIINHNAFGDYNL